MSNENTCENCKQDKFNCICTKVEAFFLKAKTYKKGKKEEQAIESEFFFIVKYDSILQN